MNWRRAAIFVVTLMITTTTANSQEIHFYGSNNVRFADGTRLNSLQNLQFSGIEKSSGVTTGYLENWADISAIYNNWFATFRYEFDDPSEYGLNRNDIVNWSIYYDNENYSLNAGTFEELFGRGLTLNLYEDRSIFYDNRLENGGKFKYDNDRFSATFLRGNNLFYETLNENTARQDYNNVTAAEFSISPINRLNLGVSLVNVDRDTLSPDGTVLNKNNSGFRIKGYDRETGFYSIFAAYEGFDDWQLYFERAENRIMSDTEVNGDGFYMAIGKSGGFPNLRMEYKNFRNFAADPNDRDSPIGPYQNPPRVQRQNDLRLFELDPHFVRFNDEVGYLLEWRMPLLSGELQFLAGLGHSSLRDGKSVAPSTEKRMMPYREIFFSVERFGTSKVSYWHFNVAVSNEIRYYSTLPSNELVRFRDIDKISFGSEMELKIGKSLFDIRAEILRYSEVDTAKARTISFSNGDEGNEYLLSFGYTPSGRFSVSTGTEWSSIEGDIIKNRAKGPWTFVEAKMEFMRNHNLTLWTGKVRGGRQCSGGVCRFVPDFDGFRLSLISRF
ncbi:hypothetical protein E3V55_04850 [Candidatus Marinimicrobia bacterium MT.SAG.3]|nr:hypothetical protein E3V55_04850 [Candidatus Marinimicrobia bacterium MT.SAG.3]